MLILTLGTVKGRAIQYDGTNHLEIEHLTNREILFDIDSQLLLRTEDNTPVNIEEWVLEYTWKNICRYYILSTKAVFELIITTQIQKIIPTAYHFSNEYSGDLKLNATQVHILEVVKQTITKADVIDCELKTAISTYRPLGRTVLSRGVRAVIKVTITTEPEDINDIIEENRKAGIELFDIKTTDLNNDFTTVNGIESTHSDSELRSEIAELNKRLQNIKTLFRINGGVLSEKQERFWSPDNWANLQLRGFPEHSIRRVAIQSNTIQPNTLSTQVEVLYMDEKEGGLMRLQCDLHGRWLGLDNGIPQSYDIVERISSQGAHNE